MILDSRGNPTVEADVWCDSGNMGRAAVPSGASTGAHEAHELRDGGAAWGGKGVTKALTNITEEIAPALRGIPADDQFKIDETLIALDGTENKARLGANALLAVSLAAAKAAANTRHVPLFKHINDIAGQPRMSLPRPMFNVLNGGQHARGASDFQEYMVVPMRTTQYQHALQIATEVFHSLHDLLATQHLPTTVGDEGGFAPPVASNTEPLSLLHTAVSNAGYEPGHDVAFALDVAASEFFTNNHYQLATENRTMNSSQMIDFLATLVAHHPIISIEDGVSEDDWDAWIALTDRLSTTQLVGDDLLVTNQTRLQRAIFNGAGNAILIKPNQIGTLTETIRTITTATNAGWSTIISHRSGETEDTTIAHLAVGTGAGQIKTGSVARGERTAKHNELLRIEEQAPELSINTMI